MLNFFDSSALGRRDFLRVGSLSLGGLSLAQRIGQADSSGASASPGWLTGKSVIFLFLHGGPSQFETFDPKMSAPEGIRSATGEIKTRLPGITFGSSFPRLAQRADRVSIVRSFATGDGNHDIKPVVSRDSHGATLGAIYSQLVGANDPVTGIPTNAALFPRSVDERAQVANFSFGKFDAVGPFTASTVPFMPCQGGSLQRDM
ncbi:MAG: DUF1501 domain-containing protein, partial [Gemmataceae bacterium]